MHHRLTPILLCFLLPLSASHPPPFDCLRGDFQLGWDTEQTIIKWVLADMNDCVVLEDGPAYNTYAECSETLQDNRPDYYDCVRWNAEREGEIAKQIFEHFGFVREGVD